MHQGAVEEDGGTGFELDRDLPVDNHLVVMEDVSLNWIIVMRHVDRMAPWNDVKAAVLDRRGIDGEPEVHRVRPGLGPEGRVLVQRSLDVTTPWIAGWLPRALK